MKPDENNSIEPSRPEPYYDFTKASNSGMDMTGAVPRPPESDAELDSFLDVYNFLPTPIVTEDVGEM